MIFILVLIFAFIFIGVKAFTIAGVFGSIVNSMFPVSAGLGLGKFMKGKDSDLMGSGL